MREPRRVHAPLLGAGLGVTYAALALGISYVTSFSNAATTAASFWPAAGVTVIALLASPRRTWPWLLAGVGIAEVAVDVHSGVGVELAAGWALANMVEPLCSALLLMRFGRRRLDLARHTDLLLFIGCAVVTGPALGALIGSTSVLVTDAGSFPLTWLRWFVGDGIGVLVIAPAVLALLDRRARRRTPKPGLIMVAAFVAFISFGPFGWLQQDSLAFLVIPALIWLAFRGGQRAAAFGVSIVATLTTLATASGWGPFSSAQGAFSGLVNAQVFLGAVAFSAFMVAVLTNDLVRRDEAEARLLHQARHDVLTGLANRRHIFERFEAAANDTVTPDSGFAFMMIDLDDFKGINDTYGHACGDAVLVETARRLESVTRTGDVIARLGGDEFMVYADGPVSEAEVESLRVRLVEAISAPIDAAGHTVTVGASVGVALSSTRHINPDVVLHKADETMYRIKRLQHD